MALPSTNRQMAVLMARILLPRGKIFAMPRGFRCFGSGDERRFAGSGKTEESEFVISGAALQAKYVKNFTSRRKTTSTHFRFSRKGWELFGFLPCEARRKIRRRRNFSSAHAVGASDAAGGRCLFRPPSFIRGKVCGPANARGARRERRKSRPAEWRSRLPQPTGQDPGRGKSSPRPTWP